MSTKIYDAWKIPAGRIDDFILGFREITFSEALTHLKKHIDDGFAKKAIELIYPDKESRDRVMSVEGWSTRYSLAYIFGNMMMVSEQGVNDLFNYDTSLNLWLDGRHAYIVPYPGNFMRDMKMMPGLLKKVGGVGYAYWDNTDRPEDVTATAWNAREKTWKRICLDDWDRSRLTHVVIEGKYPYNGFYHLQDEILGKPDPFKDFFNAVGFGMTIKRKLKEEKKAGISVLDSGDDP